MSEKSLTANFKAISSKTGKGITSQAYATALYVVIAGHSPTLVGLAYWQGMLNSGDSRSLVQQMFLASDGLLPAPTITWADPVEHHRGHAAGPYPVGRHRQR